MTNALPFFVRDGDAYVPTEASAGFWTPESINGRVVVGLLGFEIERLYGADDFQPARLTVDMYRLPDRSPMTIATRAVREGGRIKVIDAELFSRGVSVARASVQFLRRTANPPGAYWTAPHWDAPPPHTLPEPTDSHRRWDSRPIVGELGSLGPRRMWLKETRELVGGCALTPFVRVAVAADFASPFANSGEQGVGYINSDVTVYLHRLPRKDWVGFEVVHHNATDGVAVGECWLYDQDGPIGTSTVAAISQRRVES